MVSLNWDSKRREFMCPLNRVSLYGNLHFLGFHYAFWYTLSVISRQWSSKPSLKALAFTRPGLLARALGIVVQPS